MYDEKVIMETRAVAQRLLDERTLTISVRRAETASAEFFVPLQTCLASLSFIHTDIDWDWLGKPTLTVNGIDAWVIDLPNLFSFILVHTPTEGDMFSVQTHRHLLRISMEVVLQMIRKF